MATSNLQIVKSQTVNSSPNSPEEELRENIYAVLQQAGGDPSQLLELIALAIEEKIWEKIGVDFLSFVTSPFAKGGLGWSLENLRSLLKMQHRHETVDAALAEKMEQTRHTVENLLIPTALSWGGNRYVCVSTGLQQVKHTPRERILARLKRDHPALAEQVMAGKISANKAAIQVGIRKERFQVKFDDISALAQILATHLTVEQRVLLVKALLEQNSPISRK